MTRQTHSSTRECAATTVPVSAHDVTVTFPVPGGEPVEVLHGIDLAVTDGDFVAIMGPSGSGKSTLLYALAGLCPLTAGEVRLVGEDFGALGARELERLRLHNLGFVFQQPNLLAGLTLAENVELPAAWHRGHKRETTRERVRELLHRMGVSEVARNDAASASGGQRQRAGIARALINSPQVVFADEPTGALDSASSDAVMELLMEVNASGVTVVLVTHDARVAARAKRLLVLSDGRLGADIELGPFVPDQLEARVQTVTEAVSTQ